MENKVFETDLLEELETMEETEKEEWKITDASAADWAMETIQEHRQRFAEYEKVVEARKAKLDEQLKEQRDKLENETAFLLFKLDEYLDDSTAPARDTKTMRILELPSGRFERKFERPRMVQDREKLTELLSETEFVSLEPKLAWGDYKKEIEIAGIYTNTITGEAQVTAKEPKGGGWELTGYTVVKKGTDEQVEGVGVELTPASFDLK